MRKILLSTSLLCSIFTSASVSACSFIVKHVGNEGGQNPEPEPEPDTQISDVERFENYNNWVDSFNQGANFKLYDNYMQNQYLRLGTKDSKYVPTNNFVHLNDEIKVYLDATKTSTEDINFIKNNPAIFAIGMDGHWGNTLEPYLNPSYTAPAVGEYYKSAQKSAVTSLTITSDDNNYVVTMKAPRFGILYKHIASELFITKILINNVENDISRTVLTYKTTDNEHYQAFWNDVYAAYDQFIKDGANIEKQITTSTPMVIFYGERFNFIVDIIKVFMIIKTASVASVDYKNSNLNNFLNALDFVGNSLLEYQGISTKGLGAYNKLPAFQKQNVVLSDGGAGLFYNTNQYFAMHSSMTGGSFSFDSYTNTKSTFYKAQQFTSTFTGRYGNGWLRTNDNYKADLQAFLKQSIWGFAHELGHNYQMSNYKLTTWGEVTVNISPIGINAKAWSSGIYGTGENFYDSLYNRTEFKNLSDVFKTNGVRKNVLYESAVNGAKNYDPVDSSKTQTTNWMELVFWVQLCSGLGDSFIAELNNYYRANDSAIYSRIVQLTRTYEQLKANYSANFVAENHAKMDVLIESITKITNLNLKTFFINWGLEIPEATLDLMESYGTDYGANLFKIIFDKEFSGLNNQTVWYTNITGGFLLPNVDQKMLAFEEWGIEKKQELNLSQISYSNPVLLSGDTTMRFLINYQHLQKPTINYQVSETLGDNYAKQSFITNYIKVRGDNGSSSLNNEYYFHIFVNNNENKIYFVKPGSGSIDNTPGVDNYFAIVDILNSNNIGSSVELRSNGIITPNNFSKSFLPGYKLVLKFRSNNYIGNSPSTGSKIWNHETNSFDDFSNLQIQDHTYTINF